jgi:flagellar protein FliS
MFAATAPLPQRRAAALAGMYRQTSVHTGVDSASPHRLVAMLYDGLLEDLALAKGAIAAGQVEQKGLALGRAVRIVEEGLRACLDLKAGGALAADLNDLYVYVARRLTEANLRNDANAIDECKRLIEPVQQAWLAIAPQADVAARRDAR